MAGVAYTLFETAIGHCAVAWNTAGIVALQLPESSLAATVARVREKVPGAAPRPPPPVTQRAIAAIERLLLGGAETLSTIELDLSTLSPFYRRVYAAARAIPAGETLTYGQLAERVGEPGAARAVGQAMARNPFPLIVPCHRVMAARGGVGGFSAHGGIATKLRLLHIEGVALQQALPLG